MTTEHPPRRWYQFRLSTILVLVGLAAWMMAIGGPFRSDFRKITHAEWLRSGGRSTQLERDLDSLSGTGPLINPTRMHWRHIEGTASQQFWPTLALVAFLTWKLAWAIAARRKRVTQSPPQS